MRTSRLVVLGLCVLTVLEIAPTSLPIRAAAVQAKGAVEGMATFTPPKMPSPTPVNPSPSTSLTPGQGNISNRPPTVSAGNNSPRHHGHQFPSMGFNGISPADPDISVGSGSVVEVVNVAYAVYSKSTHALTTSLTLKSLFAGLDGNAFCIDVRTIYWAWDDRFIISCLDRNYPSQAASLIAISKTGDPNGSWSEYALATGGLDQPKVVVSADKIVLAGDNNFGTLFSIYQKSDMLAGIFHVRFATLQSTVGNYQAAINNTNGWDAKFVGWAAGNLDISVYNISGSPASNNVVGTAWDLGFFNLGKGNIRNFSIPGGTLGRNYMDGRILRAMEEVETSDNKEVMVFSAMYNCGGYICPIIGKIDLSGAPVYYGGNHSGSTYGENNMNVIYGSVGMDAAGNTLIVSSRANSSNTPGAALMSPGHYYKVIYGNTPGTNACNSSTGSCAERWGDYFGVAQDPSNRSHVWVVGAYQNGNGDTAWGTVIAEATSTQIF